MKKIFLLLLLGLNTAYGYGNNVGKYYVGFGYKHSWISGRGDYRHMFESNHPGLQAYIGYRAFDFWSFEIGYDWTTRHTKTYHVPQGGPLLGITADTTPIAVKSKIRFKNTYFDVHYMILGNAVNNAFFLLGLSNIRPHVDIRVTPPTGHTHQKQLEGMRAYGRTSLRAGAGFEGMFSPTWGGRATIQWENSGRIRFRPPAYTEGKSLIGKEKPFSNGISLSASFYWII